MLSASLLLQARRRAGLSQSALAARAGLAQQDIARYERGGVTPSLERLRALIAACGLELTLGLARADDSYEGQIAANLAMTPSQRLAATLRDTQSIRDATTSAGTNAHPRPAPDVIGVLRVLNTAAVNYVLTGEIAEALHGSPLLAISSRIQIVARAGQAERLSTAITALGARPHQEQQTGIDAPTRWTVARYRTELVIVPAPPGTYGYEDLRRDASQVRVNGELDIPVASLVDLVRIAEAGDGPARVPALRRTLELTAATATAGARAA